MAQRVQLLASAKKTAGQRQANNVPAVNGRGVGRPEWCPAEAKVVVVGASLLLLLPTPRSDAGLDLAIRSINSRGAWCCGW